MLIVLMKSVKWIAISLVALVIALDFIDLEHHLSPTRLAAMKR